MMFYRVDIPISIIEPIFFIISLIITIYAYNVLYLKDMVILVKSLVPELSNFQPSFVTNTFTNEIKVLKGSKVKV